MVAIRKLSSAWPSMTACWVSLYPLRLRWAVRTAWYSGSKWMYLNNILASQVSLCMSGQLDLTRLPWPLLANLDCWPLYPGTLHAQLVVRRLTKPDSMGLDWESSLP